jgi:hypothetical protein
VATMSGTGRMPIFGKLNLGSVTSIVVFNPPDSFESELASLDGVIISRDPKKLAAFKFSLAFVNTRKELDRISKLLAASAEGDALLWFAYPKGTSKRYTCEFNRDTGWDVIRNAGFDTVRAVAIDEDWSALRFRRNEFIKVKS